MPDFQVDTWYGVLTAAGTPSELIARLNRELVKSMQASDMSGRLEGMGVQPLASTPAAFGDFIANETAKWAKVVKEAGAKAD